MMRKNGVGGANTQSGLHFEKEVDFLTIIGTRKDYSVEGSNVFYKGELVASCYKKHDLYKFLESKGVDHKEILSCKLLPDDAIYVIHQNKIYILEVKFQEVAGSTDEKLQTCGFKIKQYKKLLAPLKIDVEYIYILNDWFNKSAYKDVLEHIKSEEGCDYYFNELPLKRIGLPE